jgi:hypothetical protein
MVAIGDVDIGDVDDIGDGVESHERKVGQQDVVAVNLGCDGAAAENGFSLIKPEGGA